MSIQINPANKYIYIVLNNNLKSLYEPYIHIMDAITATNPRRDPAQSSSHLPAIAVLHCQLLRGIEDILQLPLHAPN